MILVFNASPVIVLAKAGLLDDLVGLGDPAIVPQAVVDEIGRVDDAMDAARLWLEKPGRRCDFVAAGLYVSANNLADVRASAGE